MKFKKFNNYFSKMLFYGTIEIVLVIVIAASVLYYAFSKAQLKVICESSMDSLSQVSYSANFMVDSAKSLLGQMYYDDNISKLRMDTNIEPQDLLTNIRLLTNYSSSMPFVDSIYIYNKKNDTFYTTLTNMVEVNGNNFFDKDIIKLLNDSKVITIGTPFERKLAFAEYQVPNMQSSNVFTFIYPQYNSNGLDSAIVVNVSEYWVKKVITALNLEKEDKILIVDSTGKILSSVYNSDIQTNVSENNDFSFIKNIKNNSGYFTMMQNNNKFLVSYVTTEGLGWKYIRIMPYSKITGLLNNIRDITLLVCFIILIIGFGITFIVSKQLYKPINETIMALKKSSQGNIKDYRAMKEEYFKGLLLGETQFNEGEFTEKAKEFGITLLHNEAIVLILIRIDHFYDICNRYNCYDRSNLRFGIANIGSELLSSRYIFEAVDASKDSIAFIINKPSDEDGVNVTSMGSILKEIQQHVKSCLNISVSCSVSSESKSLFELSKLYNDTVKASMYRTFYGFESIIYSNDLVLNSEYCYPLDKEKALIDSLMLDKLDDVYKLYKCIINEEFVHINYAQFDSAILRLVFSISTAIETMEKVQQIKIDYNFSMFIGKLNTLESLVEIEEHFFMMFKVISSKIEEKKELKYEELIFKITGIIDDNYNNSGLCIDSIAEIVGMSPVYLGRLFKKNTMKSIADYINDIRMVHAVEYLKTTDMSINDIVEKVGFSNRSYFHTLFKKKYATTPNEYRKYLNNFNMAKI